MRKTILATFIISASIILLTSGTINLANLFNYENQTVPEYITMDNTPFNNAITNQGATLGRILFYDKKLSTNNTISCASCHKQEFAFSDRAQFSQGVNGETFRHSIRLINTRFSEETNFFWDERASSLEAQVIMPIKDPVEMGFSGENGAPNFQDLIIKLSNTNYYPNLFKNAFNSTEISEEKIANALAQFVRSIQSFDSKYDEGLALVNNLNNDFPNFTSDENAGKRLFTEDFVYNIEEVTIEKFSGDIVTTAAHRISGGLNCASCHRPPEFDIDPQSLNNGFDRPLNGNSIQNREFTVTRSATLRDLMNPNGTLNSTMFHAGTTNDFIGGIMANYNFKETHAENNNLDPRLTPEGYPQFLDITNQEKNQLLAFINTLTGKNIYTNEKWSNPFDENGDITIIDGTLSTTEIKSKKNYIKVYPNPVINKLTVTSNLNINQIKIINIAGKTYKTLNPKNESLLVDVSMFSAGTYFVQALDVSNKVLEVHKIIKE